MKFVLYNATIISINSAGKKPAFNKHPISIVQSFFNIRLNEYIWNFIHQLEFIIQIKCPQFDQIFFFFRFQCLNSIQLIMIINNRLLFLLSFQYWPLFLLIICPLFVSIPCKRIHNSTLRIGFLSSFRYGLGKIIAGAVPLAIQNLNRFKFQFTILILFNIFFLLNSSDKKILANHNLSFTGIFFIFF